MANFVNLKWKWAMAGHKLTSCDRQILDLLQRNATLSVGDIAERVGISKSACWRRIHRLEEEGVIRERVTLLNQDKVNLPLTVYIVIRTNRHNDQWAAQFNEVVQGIAEILEVHRMSGDVDYLIKAVVTDMPGYDRLYKELIKADLFDVSSSFVMETMKQTTRLPLNYIA
ncbi:Lrp/AsnC family transcriptional regulator [Microbulbifer thermotolerans]|nr:Lrp/AsnC family transcriptional regulator [Microbulbifer thermotolerans]